MRTYELVVVLKPSLNEASRKKLLDSVKAWLSDVKVAKEEDWGSKALKYKISRELTGFYYDFEVEGETMPSDFDRKVLLNEAILRYLVVRK